MNLGKNGIWLIKEYGRVLQISISESVQILMKNKTTQTFLAQESALRLTGRQYNLGILLRATLLRDMSNRNPLQPREKELIQEYYRFAIGDEKVNNILIDSKRTSDEKKIMAYIEYFFQTYAKPTSSGGGFRRRQCFPWQESGVAAKAPERSIVGGKALERVTVVGKSPTVIIRGSRPKKGIIVAYSDNQLTICINGKKKVIDKKGIDGLIKSNPKLKSSMPKHRKGRGGSV